jgi:hypothetical protein
VSRRAIIERERRWARWVAPVAGLPLLLFFLSLLLRSQLGTTSGLATEALRAIDEHKGTVLGSGILAGLAYMALAPPLTFLFRAAAVRSGSMLKGLVGLCVVGPLLFGVQSIAGVIAQVQAASDFVVQEQGVGDIYSLAENLFRESTLVAIAQATGAAGLLSLIFAVVYTSLWAMRTGLLTRFTGAFGIALGVALVLGPLAQTVLPVLFMWIAYVGLVIAGRAPGMRPPAWEAGEAVPWPKPGEAPREPSSNGAVEPEEIPGLDEEERQRANRERRERARKRKRKRRT